MERVQNRGQERARAACMLALAAEFDRNPSVRWEIEGRREHLDQQDMGMLPATKLAELADLADVKGWRVALVGEGLRATLPR